MSSDDVSSATERRRRARSLVAGLSPEARQMLEAAIGDAARRRHAEVVAAHLVMQLHDVPEAVAAFGTHGLDRHELGRVAVRVYSELARADGMPGWGESLLSWLDRAVAASEQPAGPNELLQTLAADPDALRGPGALASPVPSAPARVSSLAPVGVYDPDSLPPPPPLPDSFARPPLGAPEEALPTPPPLPDPKPSPEVGHPLPAPPVELAPTAHVEAIELPSTADDGERRILDALREAYGEPRLIETATRVLRRIVAVDCGAHQLLTTVGLTQLEGERRPGPLSGWGLELTLYVAGGDEVPAWAVAMLEALATEMVESRAPFRATDTYDLDERVILLWADPRLETHEWPLGRASFLRACAVPAGVVKGRHSHLLFADYAETTNPELVSEAPAPPPKRRRPTPKDPIRARLHRLLETNGLAELQDSLFELLWRSASLVTPEEGTKTRSHFGGAAELPSKEAWPTRPGRDTCLLASIDLAEVKLDELPSNGRLLVFGVEDPGYSRPGVLALDDAFVVHVTDPEDLELVGPPLPEHLLPHHDVRVARTHTMPDPLSVHLSEHLAVVELDPYSKHDEAQLAFEEVFDRFAKPEGGPRLLGHPAPLQDDPLLEAALRSLDLRLPLPEAELAPVREEARGWRLLLQIDSARDLGFDILTGGSLYLVIRETDLRAGALERTVCVTQR